MTPLCSVLTRGHIILPTSAGISTSSSALWRCALLYYLPRDPELQAAQVPLPRSSRTIWKILHATGCLVPHSQKLPHPNELRKPLEEIQMDFKDIGSVSPEQGSQGKRQHVVEVCNFVDAGTSIALSAQAREDFHEQTALEAVITFLRQYGCPRQMTFDRDPRWVGGVSGRDFPSPLRRLLLCLGVKPHICPPHRPDKNAFVERFHRTYGQECLHIHQPSTLQEVRESQKHFFSTTITNVPTRDGPVAMSLRVSRFRPCRHYQRFQNALTRMPGWPPWIRRCICVMWGEMAA